MTRFFALIFFGFACYATTVVLAGKVGGPVVAVVFLLGVAALALAIDIMRDADD